MGAVSYRKLKYTYTIMSKTLVDKIIYFIEKKDQRNS